MGILKKQKIKPQEEIEMLIPYSIKDKIENGESVSVEIVHVQDWYDNLFYVNGKCIIISNYIRINLQNTLSLGLYVVLCVKNKDGEVIVGKTHDTSRILDAFTVGGTSNKNPILMYQDVVNNRNNIFNMPKYDFDKKGSIPYDVFAFCKNINVATSVQYGDIKVIPFDKLRSTSEIEYVNTFLENEGYTLEFDIDKNSTTRPSAVFIMKNVFAFSDDAAVEYVLNRARLINNLFTLMMQGNGEVFAVVVFDQNKQAAQFRIIQPHYIGNLLKIIHQGHFIRTYYDSLKETTSFFKLIIRLLTDAMNEEDKMIKYYRFWIILEELSNKNVYANEIMKKWDGEEVKNKNGKSVLIGENALNKVFEYIRRSGLYLNEFYKVESLNTPKEFLSVCYQRRCCAAHHGGCINSNPEICDKNTKSNKLCSDNMVMHGNPKDVFSDQILWKLQQLTFSIVKLEMEQHFGMPHEECNFVSSIIGL